MTKKHAARKPKGIDFSYARAGLEVLLAPIMDLTEDLAVVVRDPVEQMMIYRAKPAEALRVARRLAALIDRVHQRTVDAMLRPPLRESRPSREK